MRTGLVDEPGHRKIHGEPIPLAGGFAVMTGLIVPTAIALLVIGLQHVCQMMLAHGVSPLAEFWMRHSPLNDDQLARLIHGLQRRALEIAAIFSGAAGMLLVGTWMTNMNCDRPPSSRLNASSRTRSGFRRTRHLVCPQRYL